MGDIRRRSFCTFTLVSPKTTDDTSKYHIPVKVVIFWVSFQVVSLLPVQTSDRVWKLGRHGHLYTGKNVNDSFVNSHYLILWTRLSCVCLLRNMPPRVVYFRPSLWLYESLTRSGVVLS